MTGASAECDSSAWAVFDLKWYDTREQGAPWAEVNYEDGACPVKETVENGWDHPTYTVMADQMRVKHTWLITEYLDFGELGTGEAWSLLVEFEDGHLKFFDSRYYGISSGHVPKRAKEKDQEVTLF